MPGKKSPGPSVKNPKQYEDLIQQGMSKSEAAAIANAAHRKAYGKKTK